MLLSWVLAGVPLSGCVVLLFDVEIAAAVRAARAEGADVFLLAELVGVDRSTLYRRYLTERTGSDR